MAYLVFGRCVQQGCLQLIFFMLDRKPEFDFFRKLRNYLKLKSNGHCFDIKNLHKSHIGKIFEAPQSFKAITVSLNQSCILHIKRREKDTIDDPIFRFHLIFVQ